MEQFIKENFLNLLPVALMLVWFIITCIKGFAPKKWLYVTELAVLFVSTVCNIVFACISVIEESTVEAYMMILGWAVISGFLLLIELQDFHKRFYR